ncbi:unnamed protein product [Chrysoparadoxa australica]
MLLDPFAAAAAAHLISSTPLDTSLLNNSPVIASSTLLAKTETREGIYGSYEVELQEQQRDNAASTFKTQQQTEKGRSKYTSILGVLLVGSFVIPMVQYFWYIREEDDLDL